MILTVLLFRLPGCVCGRCVLPVMVGPAVTQMFIDYQLDQAGGHN